MERGGGENSITSQKTKAREKKSKVKNKDKGYSHIDDSLDVPIE